MRRIAIILAVGSLMAGEVHAESAAIDRQHSVQPDEQERATKPLWKWLPKVLGKSDGDSASPSDAEPAAAEPAPPPQRQPSRRTFAPEPEPEPEPKLTPEQQEAEDRWWKETGDPAVAAFSRCLQEHVVDEVSGGNQSSYPDYVTTAMNSRCAREFAGMAQLILDRHGQDNFARIARKLIAGKFVPAVKQVVEGGADVIPPTQDAATIEADMRRSKETMFDCFVDEADRLATRSAALAEEVADQVIAACQTPANAYFDRLELLYPGATGREASGTSSAAILEASYRPAILQRIASLRADNPGSGVSGGKADAETASQERPETGSQEETASQERPETAIQKRAESITPVGEPAQASPVPASNRP